MKWQTTQQIIIIIIVLSWTTARNIILSILSYLFQFFSHHRFYESLKKNNNVYGAVRGTLTVHPLHSANWLLTFTPSQLTWAMSLPVGYYSLHSPSPCLLVLRPKADTHLTVSWRPEGYLRAEVVYPSISVLISLGVQHLCDQNQHTLSLSQAAITASTFLLSFFIFWTNGDYHHHYYYASIYNVCKFSSDTECQLPAITGVCSIGKSVDELGLLEKMSVQNFRQRLKVSVVDKVVCTSQRRFDLYKPASELNPRIWLWKQLCDGVCVCVFRSLLETSLYQRSCPRISGWLLLTAATLYLMYHVMAGRYCHCSSAVTSTCCVCVVHCGA